MIRVGDTWWEDEDLHSIDENGVHEIIREVVFIDWSREVLASVPEDEQQTVECVPDGLLS